MLKIFLAKGVPFLFTYLLIFKSTVRSCSYPTLHSTIAPTPGINSDKYSLNPLNVYPFFNAIFNSDATHLHKQQHAPISILISNNPQQPPPLISNNHLQLPPPTSTNENIIQPKSSSNSIQPANTLANQ